MLIEGIPDGIIKREYDLYKYVIGRENGEDPSHKIEQGSSVLNWAISDVPMFVKPRDVKSMFPHETDYTAVAEVSHIHTL